MAESFVTLAEFRDYLDADVTDPEAQAAIDTASEVIRRYCEREFTFEDDVTELVDGTGTDALVLPSPPIRGVVSVTESGVELTEGVDFAIRQGAGVLRRLWCWWTPGVLNVEVIYHRGYDADGISYPGLEAFPLPAPIRAATLSLAKRISASGSLPVGGFRGEVIGGYQYTLGDAASASLFYPTVDERAMLDPYRMPRVA